MTHSAKMTDADCMYSEIKSRRSISAPTANGKTLDEDVFNTRHYQNRKKDKEGKCTKGSKDATYLDYKCSYLIFVQYPKVEKEIMVGKITKTMKPNEDKTFIVQQVRENQCGKEIIQEYKTNRRKRRTKMVAQDKNAKLLNDENSSSDDEMNIRPMHSSKRNYMGKSHRARMPKINTNDGYEGKGTASYIPNTICDLAWSESGESDEGTVGTMHQIASSQQQCMQSINKQNSQTKMTSFINVIDLASSDEQQNLENNAFHENLSPTKAASDVSVNFSKCQHSTPQKNSTFNDSTIQSILTRMNTYEQRILALEEKLHICRIASHLYESEITSGLNSNSNSSENGRIAYEDLSGLYLTDLKERDKMSSTSYDTGFVDEMSSTIKIEENLQTVSTVALDCKDFQLNMPSDARQEKEKFSLLQPQPANRYAN